MIMAQMSRRNGRGGMPEYGMLRGLSALGRLGAADDPSTTGACPLTATQVVWSLLIAGGAFGVGLALGTTWGAKSLRSG